MGSFPGTVWCPEEKRANRPYPGRPLARSGRVARTMGFFPLGAVW